MSETHRSISEAEQRSHCAGAARVPSPDSIVSGEISAPLEMDDGAFDLLFETRHLPAIHDRTTNRSVGPIDKSEDIERLETLCNLTTGFSDELQGT
jgi:hypothetical protein